MSNTPEDSIAGPGNNRPADLSSNQSVDNQDIHDSAKDTESMKEEPFVIDLPDVSDIPGQEHIHVPHFGEMADVTISSDDEEGVGLFNDGDEEDEPGIGLIMGTEADVNTEERKALKAAAEDIVTEDNTQLREAALDNIDDEGDKLNEESSATKISGKDLDVSGADSDDTDEAVGEEDEENNSYSLGADDKDEIRTDEF